MPEGPEVKHTTDLLKKYLQGKSLKSVEIFGGRYSRHGPPKGWNTLQEYLNTHPLKIDKVDCIGKFIYWRFINHEDKPFYMSCTLGMSGQWCTLLMEHCHLHFTLLSNDQKISKVYFRDIRNFGTLQFDLDISKKISQLGSDILSGKILSDSEIIHLFRLKNNWTLPKFVMNQSYLCGVGNYIKSEALFRARISPHRYISDINNATLIDFYHQVRNIAQQSYLAKGASFKTFRDPDRNKGSATHFFEVYGKKIYQEYLVKREITDDGRTTHWIPELQI